MKHVNADEMRQRRQPNPDRVAAIKRSVAIGTALHKLRERVALVDPDLAERLAADPALVGLETADEICIGPLHRYVETLGGRLEIVATVLGQRTILLTGVDDGLSGITELPNLGLPMEPVGQRGRQAESLQGGAQAGDRPQRTIGLTIEDRPKRREITASV